METLKNCRRRDLNPYRFLHTPLKRARLPFRHSDTNGIIQFSKLFILSSWRSNRFRFCPLHQKQHLVAFSSAECHSDTNGIIQFSKLFILSSWRSNRFRFCPLHPTPTQMELFNFQSYLFYLHRRCQFYI